jgi:hypothetical protein
MKPTTGWSDAAAQALGGEGGAKRLQNGHLSKSFKKARGNVKLQRQSDDDDDDDDEGSDEQSEQVGTSLSNIDHWPRALEF